MPYKDVEKRKEYEIKYHLQNKEKKIKLSKKWREENKDKYNEFFREKYKDPVWKEKHTKLVKSWRDRNLEKARKYSREYAKSHPMEQRKAWLWRKYKLTLENYAILLKSQKSKCEICGGNNLANKRNKYLCVDHNHKTGEVRGLLCHNCNAMIGYAKENIKNLNKGIEYIKKHTIGH